MKADITHLINRIFDGYSILFIGSGFSNSATNINGETLPTGFGLFTLLSDALGLTANYPLDILSREYSDKFGEHGLLTLLSDRLTASSVTISQKAIVNLPWRRIYTTNYDNVVDLCNVDTNIIRPATIRDKVNRDRRPTQCVYLNGRLASTSIRTFHADIKLTRASYLTDTFLGTHWASAFKNDLALATVVFFVGYSMYDLDIARIVYEDPMLKAKTGFIDSPDLDPVFKRELSQFGEVFAIGSDEFASEVRKAQPREPRSANLTSFSRYTAPNSASSPTADDITSLFVRGELRDEVILGAKTGEAKYTINRPALDEILKRIDSGANKFLVHADIGNGKTVLLHLLRIALQQRGWSIITLKPNYDNADDDIRLIAESPGRFAIIIDEFFRNKELIQKLCYASPTSLVISTVRTSIFDLRNNEVKDIFQQEFVEIDLNRLFESEAQQLVQIADQNGLWGYLGAKTLDNKLRFIQTTCGNEIRSFLLRLFESPSFKERIRDTFYPGMDGEILNCIVNVLLLDVANFEPDLLTVSELAGVDFLREAKLKRDETSREYIDFASGRVRVKSSVLSQFILKEIIDYDVTLRYLTKAVRACEEGRHDNSTLREIQKEFMKFSFIDKIFARTRNTNHYVQFYDGLRTLRSMSRNPQFWLQYAIARIEHSEFRSADMLLRTAYSHAKNIKDYNTFQIDNHFARYLLVSRTLDGSYGDYFKAFLDAHNLLIKQAKTEPHAYYPFKVARLYYDFVVRNESRLVPEQRPAVQGAINQMIAQIDQSSKHVLRYALVEEARRELTRAMDLMKTS